MIGRISIRTASSTLLIFMLAACGGSDGMRPAVDADVSGSWTYSAEGLSSGTGITCSFTGIQATVNQSGNSFMGVTQGGQWICTSILGELGDALGPQTIGEGTVQGNEVSFEIDGLLLFVHTGTVSGNSMSGSVQATGTVDPIGPITLTGSWTATR